MYRNVSCVLAAESSAKESEKQEKQEEGKEGEGEVVDPFLDYYLQAESSVEALVNIRCVCGCECV